MSDDDGDAPSAPSSGSDVPADEPGEIPDGDSGTDPGDAVSGTDSEPDGDAESGAETGPDVDAESGADTGPRAPPAHRVDDQDGPEGLREWIHWFRTVETGPAMVARELLSSVMLVLGVGLLLFAISGVWPPMVAVQSGSMNPHMYKNDLVFIVEETRFAPGEKAVEGTGVVPYAEGARENYTKFGAPGDVIIYEPDGSSRRDPIIHRAHFWVDEGENWFDRANESHVGASSCVQLRYCPAPNSGFITKGDNPDTNEEYDQVQQMSRPVKPEWIKGKAMVRIPGLGWIRLQFGSLAVAGRAGIGALGLGLVAGRRTLRA